VPFFLTILVRIMGYFDIETVVPAELFIFSEFYHEFTKSVNYK
jgi:hypothetical protein